MFAFFNDADDVNVAHPGGEVQAVGAKVRDSFVHVRGDFLRPGAKVEPHTPAFLPSLSPRGKRADRLDLARWIASADNPLTPRVAVNHAWQHLFGKPLVPTPDNLGVNGERPSHPDLLDWLASEFVANGWSRKELIRLIVTSATYRQSSRGRPELREHDPGNTLLARQNRFRVEAEVVRDLALAVSGLLDRRIGGPRVQPPLPTGLARLGELKNESFMEASAGADRFRRGVYVNVQRTFPFPTFQAFDAPDGNECVARRDRSTTPAQALTLLNDPVFAECARALGGRLRKEGPTDNEARLRYAWRLCLGREPGSPELAALDDLLSHLPGDAAARWAGMARTLLNLDEFTTRE
jgi:hypothetical protein